MTDKELLPAPSPCASGNGCDRCMEWGARSGQDAGAAGWRLALPAAIVFLVPLLAAIGGAAWGRASAVRQTVGAFAGLAAGLAAAVWGMRMARTKPERGKA